MKDPMTGDYNASSVAGGMNQLSLPLPAAAQLSLELGKRQGKLGLEQFVGVFSERLGAAIAVELFASGIPHNDAMTLVEHQNLREVQHLGLLQQRSGLLAQ